MFHPAALGTMGSMGPMAGPVAPMLPGAPPMMPGGPPFPGSMPCAPPMMPGPGMPGVMYGAPGAPPDPAMMGGYVGVPPFQSGFVAVAGGQQPLSQAPVTCTSSIPLSQTQTDLQPGSSRPTTMQIGTGTISLPGIGRDDDAGHLPARPSALMQLLDSSPSGGLSPSASPSSLRAADDPEDAPPRPSLIVKPRLPPLTPGSSYEFRQKDKSVLAVGMPLYINFEDGGDAFQLRGFDTTGDGFVDSVDTTGDGYLDQEVLVVLKEDDVRRRAGDVFDAIDIDGNSQISKLDLVRAMQSNTDVDGFVLPEIEGASAFSDTSGSLKLSDSRAFEAVEALFAAISGSAPRVNKEAFVDYFNKQQSEWHDDVLQLFQQIDVDHSGMVSKHELVCAVQRLPEVAKLVFPDSDGPVGLSDEVWDKIDVFFQSLSGGKKWVFFEDFATFYHIHAHPEVKTLIPKHKKLDRLSKKVLIIGPGFGRELNPTQSAIVMRSGYCILWVLDIPNPESPGFQMHAHIHKVLHAYQQFKPDLVVSASKGWQYLVELWRFGNLNCAALMINAHPTLAKLPPNMNVVVAHGSNDELYPRTRESLEALMATADYNRVFLYWSCNSGMVNGGYSRYGDKHNMDSLVRHDTLPRLMDAALSKCPENEMVFSWRDRLSPERIDAEDLLSGDPNEWVKKWDATSTEIRVPVQADTPEFNAVVSLFFSQPPEPANYQQQNVGGQSFERTRICKIERVQNSSLVSGAQTHYKKLQELFQTEQKIEFEPNVHTRWVFHGTDKLEEIITDPITGFQPLVSGSRLGSLWGAGTYFARDAKYVVESNFCSPGPDGLKRMALALVTIGIPCVGAPEQKGVLPYRNGKAPYKYTSTVDSLSNPEIFITQQPSAAYPAYVITYQ